MNDEQSFINIKSKEKLAMSSSQVRVTVGMCLI